MAQIKPREAVVTIYQGDYLDRIQHLEQKAEAAERAADPTRSLMDVPEYLAIAEEHDALVREAEESAIHVRLRALRRSEWKRMVSEHPPRKDSQSDLALGVNEDTFREALVPASLVEPADFGEDDLDYLSDADYGRLYLTAFSLNRSTGGDPKANLVSRMSQKNDETTN